MENYARLKAALKNPPTVSHLSFEQLNALDTAGVLLMADCFGKALVQKSLQQTSISPERKAMIEAVLQALPSEETRSLPQKNGILARIGCRVSDFFTELVHWLGFFGMVLASFSGLLFKPKEWRITSLFANIDRSGLQAVPIVVLLCFMVGAVVAFLGATVLANFGAEIFTIHLVSYSFLREFAVLLTAILLAGRTASAYTAQLGSMKVNEEIDALKASGIDPLSVLVVPRVLALLIAMPLLTFLGMLSGISGGMLVAAFSMDISPRLFFEVLSQSVHVKHFLVGIGKAPIFAIVIAITGCLEGFKVTGSAQSVGEHTTASVVKCIFLVILLDALLAIFLMEMKW